MEKIVTAAGHVSFSAMHGSLNGYGTAIVRIQFLARRYLPQITDAVQALGWEVEDANWGASGEITLIRTGAGLAGKQAELARELSVALAPIPNEILFLEPKVSRVDYSRLPKWTVQQSSGAPATSRHVVFGSNPGKALPRHYAVAPANGAARILDGKPLWNWPPKWRVIGRTLAYLAGSFATLAVGAGLELLVQSQNLTSVARDIPGVAMLYWPRNLFQLGFTLWLSVLGVGLAIASAIAIGLVHLVRLVASRTRPAPAGSHPDRRPEPSTTDTPTRTPKIDAPKESSKSRHAVGYQVIKVALCLYTVGAGYAIPPVCAYTSDLWESTGPDSLGYFALTLGIFGALGVGVGLWAAARKMTLRRYPRLAINVGAIVAVCALLLRAPAWAYLDGLGAAWLWDSLDSTSLLSLSTQFILYLLVAGAYGAILLWFFRVAPSTLKHLMQVPILLILLLQGFIVLGPAWQAGRSLGETGTAANARGNYPIAACLAQAHTMSESKPGAYGSSQVAVWILAAKDGRLIVTDRAEDDHPLDHPGRIRSLPAADYVVQMVRYSSGNASAENKCIQN
ncbi:hypothetical protein [Arthrobacter sp. RCC_34]|uniref:hypothetical protein n=1 Tax=Arthrobacter sp. RCC_34 TaxID=3239230 RepID=UPI00352396FA